MIAIVHEGVSLLVFNLLGFPTAGPFLVNAYPVAGKVRFYYHLPLLHHVTYYIVHIYITNEQLRLTILLPDMY